jgi:hypothetical protein
VPSSDDPMQPNGDWNRRVGQPVGNLAPLEIGDSGGQRKSGREDPNSLIHTGKILQVAECFGEPILDNKPRKYPKPQNKKAWNDRAFKCYRGALGPRNRCAVVLGDDLPGILGQLPGLRQQV